MSDQIRDVLVEEPYTPHGALYALDIYAKVHIRFPKAISRSRYNHFREWLEQQIRQIESAVVDFQEEKLQRGPSQRMPDWRLLSRRRSHPKSLRSSAPC